MLEDTTVHFTLHDANRASYTVCDGPTGKQETIECSCQQLGAAVALAIGSDEIVADVQALYILAEQCMPEALVLRWIP